MYAASVSIIVLSYSFREATLRASESLMRDSLCGWGTLQLQRDARRRQPHASPSWLPGHRSVRMRRSFWIFCFSSSSCRIWRFTSSRFSFRSSMPLGVDTVKREMHVSRNRGVVHSSAQQAQHRLTDTDSENMQTPCTKVATEQAGAHISRARCCSSGGRRPATPSLVAPSEYNRAGRSVSFE